jgi:hypothetical protein
VADSKLTPSSQLLARPVCTGAGLGRPASLHAAVGFPAQPACTPAHAPARACPPVARRWRRRSRRAPAAPAPPWRLGSRRSSRRWRPRACRWWTSAAAPRTCMASGRRPTRAGSRCVPCHAHPTPPRTPAPHIVQLPACRGVQPPARLVHLPMCRETRRPAQCPAMLLHGRPCQLASSFPYNSRWTGRAGGS